MYISLTRDHKVVIYKEKNILSKYGYKHKSINDFTFNQLKSILYNNIDLLNIYQNTTNFYFIEEPKYYKDRFIIYLYKYFKHYKHLNISTNSHYIYKNLKIFLPYQLYKINII